MEKKKLISFHFLKMFIKKLIKTCFKPLKDLVKDNHKHKKKKNMHTHLFSFINMNFISSIFFITTFTIIWREKQLHHTWHIFIVSNNMSGTQRERNGSVKVKKFSTKAQLKPKLEAQ